jgi:outer membrane protein assembly factor BamB
VNAETGERIWTYETDNFVNGAPAISDGRIVVGGCDARIHIVSASDGTSLAEAEVGAYVAASAAVVDGHAYVGHYGNEFLCVNTETAKIQWIYKDRSFPYFSSPAVGADRVVVGCRDRRVHCIDRETGKSLWTFSTRGKVDSSPVICGDKVVVGSDDGRLYLIGLSDGIEVWSYEIGEAIVSSPSVCGGIVLVGSEDGFIYAFGPKE